MVKESSEMLAITNNSNKTNTLTSNCRIVIFVIVNIFPSIDNHSGLIAGKSVLDARQNQFPTTACIIEALEYV